VRCQVRKNFVQRGEKIFNVLVYSPSHILFVIGLFAELPTEIRIGA
jgi:hypothetical protein